MEIYWDRDGGKLSYDGKTVICVNSVRNELNGRRLLHHPSDVVHTIPDRFPYMPRKFPLGRWLITGVKYRPQGDPIYGPAFIQTNAFQQVNVWELDEQGGYAQQSNQLVIDRGYGIHYSTSLTTLGCGRLSSPHAAKDFAAFYERQAGAPLYLNVQGKDGQ